MRPWLLPLAVILALSVATPARASSALELVRMAHAHEAAKEDDLALRRYMEALALDPTCEEGYLGLGALRARRGDLREADNVYSMALEHVPALREARTKRAYVRRALGMRREAVEDLLAGVADGQDDVPALRVLAGWHGEDGQVPAQLAVWRHVVERAERAHDAVLLHEARRMVKALVIFVGTADPAAYPPDERGFRRLAASLARKGG